MLLAGIAGASPVPPAPQIVTDAQVLRNRLADIEHELSQRPDNDTLLRNKVDAYRQARMFATALDVCTRARPSKRPSVCDPQLIADLQRLKNTQANAEVEARREARVFAVIIGISRYQNNRMPRLPHAADDADKFFKHVQKAKTGSAAPGNIFLLKNETATVKRIRDAIESVLGRATSRDTVYLFASAHGVTEISPHDGFLMGYDSDPQELMATAYRLSELKALIRRRPAAIRQTLLYADLCRAGPFHNHPNLVQTALQQLETQGARFVAVLAGSSTEPTLNTTHDGGAGVFSYYLLRGLSGAADENGDGSVTIDELFRWVRSGIMAETRNRQRPVRFGQLDPGSPITSLRPWLHRTRGTAPPVLAFGFMPDEPQQAAPGPADEPPVEPGLAFDVASGPEEDGQQVILNYLQGNEVPQRKEDFERGAELFRLAREIKPSNAVIAREAFCLGRAATFDGRYDYALRRLSEAIQREPESAYAHNALGIAQLLLARTDDAAASFRRAIDRAPFWIYPRHNLALTLADRGEFRRAEQEFQLAIQREPNRAHLHYSLGLMYQRLGRHKDAHREYRAALAVQDLPEAHTGIGAILATEGKDALAAAHYERALQLDSGSLPARHDLGVLVAKTDPDKAVAYWEENLRRDADFIPSRLSLARAFRSDPARLSDSAFHYNELLRARPALVRARIEYADVLLRSKRPDESLVELHKAVHAEPRNFEIHEKLGDMLSQRHREAALAEYGAAGKLATRRGDRKRIAAKIHQLSAN